MDPLLIVEKIDGHLKASAVADGRTQARYTEEEMYSLTAQLESIMFNG